MSPLLQSLGCLRWRMPVRLIGSTSQTPRTWDVARVSISSWEQVTTPRMQKTRPAPIPSPRLYGIRRTRSAVRLSVSYMSGIRNRLSRNPLWRIHSHIPRCDTDRVDPRCRINTSQADRRWWPQYRNPLWIWCIHWNEGYHALFRGRTPHADE